MQLKVLAAVAILLAAASARAQEASQLIDVHGFYYKETSTRVVQPRMELAVDLPQTGTTLSANYALDAITSASVAQGAAQDAALTEYRNQVGAAVTQSIGLVRAGTSYERSRESDYDSDTVGVQAAIDLFEKNTTWGVGYAHTFDSVFNRARMVREGRLGTDFLAITASQLLSPTTVGTLGFEAAAQSGYQQNPYRTAPVGDTRFPEVLPRARNRYTGFGRLAQFVPEIDTGFQLYYRFYHDDWKLTAHTIEGRIYHDLTPTLEARLAYRYYTQDHAYFAKAMYMKDVDVFYTSDPKLFDFDSHYIEGQLRWALRGVRATPILGWFEGGWIDVTAGVLYQGSTFGSCGPTDPHQCADFVLAVGMTVPL
jgi:hypothetical protein